MVGITPSRGLSRRRLLGGLGTAVAALGAACAAPAPATPSPRPAAAAVATATTVPSTKAPAAVATATTMPSAKAPAAPTQVQITFATDWVGDPEKNPRVAMLQKGIPEFERLNPQYKVVVQPIGGEYYQKLQIQLASGTAADVIQFSGAIMYPYVKAGALAVLDPFLRDAGLAVERDFITLPKIYFNKDGKLVGMPNDAFIGGWIANATLFREAGVELPKPGYTWDDFAQIARQLSVPEKQTYGVWTNGYQHWHSFVYAAGGAFFNSDHTKSALNNGAEGLQFTYDLIHRWKASPTPAQAKALSKSWDVFGSGKIGMCNYGSNMIAWMKPEVDARYTFDWQIIPSPAHPQTGKIVESLSGNPNVVNAKAKDIQAAARWAIFLAGEFMQQANVVTRQSIPVLKKLSMGADWKREPPKGMSILVDNLEKYAVDTANFGPASLEWSRAVNKELERAWAGDAPLEQALKSAVVAGDDVLAKADR